MLDELLKSLNLSPDHVFSDEEKWMILKSHRNIALAACDWTQLPDAVLTEAQKAEWQTYREALQVIEFSNTNPDLTVFPDPPIFTNTQTPAEVLTYRVNRAGLKAQYQVTITQLQNIENTAAPTNAQVIAAVKYLAKTMLLLLKLIARII